MNYFREDEFNMDGKPCFEFMNPVILSAIDELRHIVGKPFRINSSYRDKKYNEYVGGSKHSQHLLGNAVDISTRGMNAEDKANLVREALNKGLSVGIYKTFIHLDCRASQSVLWWG